MAAISVFHAADRQSETYLGDPAHPEKGGARIARLIGQTNSTSMAGGVVIYERLTVSWDLDFDEMITIVDGSMTIRSGGAAYIMKHGDVAWFPAHTDLTYDVADRVVVSYAVFPMPA